MNVILKQNAGCEYHFTSTQVLIPHHTKNHKDRLMNAARIHKTKSHLYKMRLIKISLESFLTHDTTIPKSHLRIKTI